MSGLAATAEAAAPRREHRAAEAARRRYFPAVEGMRGVAACSVLVGHVLLYGHTPDTGLNLYGYFVATMGVWVFFGISGFLLYRPFVAARGEGDSVGSLTPSFLVRRFVRIFPAYWVALTLLAVYPGLHEVFGDNFWISYGLLRNYSNAWSTYGIGPAWTLSVEVTFYLALPLYAWAMHRFGVNSGHPRGSRIEYRTLAVLALASILARAQLAHTEETEYIGLWLPTTFAFFATGMAMAASDFAPGRATERVRGVLARPEICWPLAALLFVLRIEASFSIGEPWVWMPWTLGLLESLGAAGLLLAPAIFGDGGSAVRRLLRNRTAVFLGTISYGIYLWHLPIFFGLYGKPFAVDSPFPLATLFVGTLLAALFFGTASWYLVEKPLMRKVRSVKALRRDRVAEGATGLAEPAP